MAVTKTGSGLVARDEFERAFPSSGQASLVSFPGANLKIAGAPGARILTAFPQQRDTYAFVSQGKGLNDFVIEARVRNSTVEERTGVIFRGFVPGTDMFELRLEHDQSIAKNHRLSLYGPSGLGVGGLTKLASVAAAWVVGNFHHIKVEVKGNTFRAWFDAGITDVPAITYVSAYDLPLSYGIFGVAGGTFAGTGGSLNSWDYVRVEKSNRIRMDGLPAGHKLEISGVVGSPEVNGIAYLDLKGAGNSYTPTLHVLNAANVVVATYGPLPIDPGDVFLSGLVVVPAGSQFYNDFGAFNPGDSLGAPDFSSVAYLPAIFGDASPWVVASGIQGSINNRIARPTGAWGTTVLRWLAPGSADASQELLVRFRKVGNPGYMARLRANAAQTRGIQFGFQPDFVREDTGLNFTVGTLGNASHSSYRMYTLDVNADVGPFPMKFSDSVQLFDGAFYFLRVKVEAGNAFGRIWKADEEEPGVWQLQSTVAYLTAGFVDINTGFFDAAQTVIDSLSLGLGGYPAQNHDALFTIPVIAAVSIVPGAQRLTFFEDDDITPILGQVDPRDGTILQATVSNHPEDPRPYLNPVDEHSDSQIMVTDGNSSIGQLNFSLGDKRTNPIDQTTGWFTALLKGGLLDHRAVFQEMTVDGDWETIIDGVCGSPTLSPNLVEYSGTIKDMRDRERDVRVFTKTFFSVLPRGLPDGYGLVTEQTPDLPSPDEAFFTDDFDNEPQGTLLQNHLSTEDVPALHWLRHPNFPVNTILSYTGRVYSPAVPTNYFANFVMPSADYEVSVRIWKRSDSTGTIGVLLRDDPVATNFYYFYYDDAARRFALNRSVGGVVATIGSFAFDLPIETVALLRIRGIGTQINCYVDDDLIISVIDANIVAANKPGIRQSIAASTEDTGLQLDNFRVNDLTAVVSGSVVNGDLLVRPVTPLFAKFNATPGNPNKGLFEILWRESVKDEKGNTYNDEQWSQYSQDRWESLLKLNYASTVYNKNIGDFELRHQGVLIRWTDKWERGKPTRWRNLRDMKLGDTELIITNESNWSFIGVDDRFRILQVQAQADDINQLPADGQKIYLEVISEREPSSDEPLMLTENLGRLAQRIYDGEFRDEGTPVIQYDIAAMVKFVLDCPMTNIKITAPWENMWDGMAQNIYRPVGYVPVTDGKGRVSPKSIDLPDPKVDFPVIDDSMIEGETARWIEDDEDLVTVAEFTYYRDFLIPQSKVPISDYDRLHERPVLLARIAPSYILHKEHKITYDQPTIRSVTINNLGVGQIAHEAGAQIGTTRLRNVLSRSSNGSDRCQFVGKLSDPVIAQLQKGDWVNAQISFLPDKLTQKRGLNRIMQVIQLKRLDPRRRQVMLVDAGPYNTPVPLATVTTLGTKGTRRITADVTVVPNVDGKPVAVVLQYSVNPLSPNVDTTDPQWVTFSEDSKAGIKTSQVLPLATKAWVRFRTEFAGSRPSAWTLLGPVALGDVAIPTALNVTFPADPTAAHANFTPPDALVQSLIYLRFTDQSSDQAAQVGTVPPGAGAQTFLLTGLVPSIAYTFGVRSRDTDTGDLSPLVELDFIASNAAESLPVPLLPTPFTRNYDLASLNFPSRRNSLSRPTGVNGVYGMAVFAATLPSQVEFQQATETGISTGVYGPWLPMQDPVDSVQGDWTTAGDQAVTNDRLRRKMRARHIRQGAIASGWTAEVIVLPYTSVPLNALAQSLEVFYQKSGGTISGDAHVSGILSTDRFVLPVGVDKWALE